MTTLSSDRLSSPYRSPVRHFIDLDAEPAALEWWTVHEHVKGGMFAWDPNKIQLYLSEGQKVRGENGRIEIFGYTLLEEIRGKRTPNANMLDFLLANQHLIPEDWKCGVSGAFWYGPCFWGTIYCDHWTDGTVRSQAVRGMLWYQGVWESYTRALAFDWENFRPAAVFAP